MLGPHFTANPSARASVFLTSKVWNTNHHPAHVGPSVRKSIADLQCQYLDLVLIHWPVAWRHTGLDFSDGGGVPKTPDGHIDWAPVPLLDTWRALEALVAEGVVRSIGVSNFPLVLLADLRAGARIPPAVIQVECHPYLAQSPLLAYCTQHSIHVSAYSPLGRPGKTKAESVIHDAVVKSLAAELSASSRGHAVGEYSPAAVLLAWNVMRGVSVLPKSSTPERIGTQPAGDAGADATAGGERSGEGEVRAAAPRTGPPRALLQPAPVGRQGGRVRPSTGRGSIRVRGWE